MIVQKGRLSGGLRARYLHRQGSDAHSSPREADRATHTYPQASFTLCEATIPSPVTMAKVPVHALALILGYAEFAIDQHI